MIKNYVLPNGTEIDVYEMIKIKNYYEEQETILDNLNEKFIIALDEINKINQRLENINLDSQNIIQLLIDKEKIVPDAIKNIMNYSQFDEKLENKQIIYLAKNDDEIKIEAEKYNWVYKEKNFYKSEIEILFKELFYLPLMI